jgi:hypothetical protein
MRQTIQGIQDSGVIACAKHYVMNEQEHYRDYIHANVDDKTMHELYLWYARSENGREGRLISIQAVCRCCACRSWVCYGVSDEKFMPCLPS